MSWLRVVGARLRGLLRRRRRDDLLDEEIRFHLDMQAADFRQRGLSAEEARFAAVRSFGALEPMKEEYRDRSTFAALEGLVKDVRHAARTLRKNAGFTAASVTTLAVAIGSVVAMFSVVDAVLQRPLPYRQPEQLTMLWTEGPYENLRKGRSGYWNVLQWRQSRSFTDMAVFDGVSATLAWNDRSERATVARISPNFFDVLGVSPVHGRTFSADEAAERERVVLISHRFWQNRFGGSTDAIGASVWIDGQPSRVIGILGAAFWFPSLDADLWEPHTLFPDWQTRREVRGIDTWSVVARLRPGVSPAQAQAEMAALADSLDEQMPFAERNREIAVMPLGVHVVGSESRLALGMLSAAVLCVLLIAALNIANLSVARCMTRLREVAIRKALGATSGRIVRQILTESLLVAAAAGMAGSLLASVIVESLEGFGAAALGLPSHLSHFAVDTRALAVALLISMAAGMLIGVAPAAVLWRRNVSVSMQDSRTMSGGRVARALRQTLVVSEFALAIVLLFWAGLLIRSWQRLEGIDSGFRPERVLTLEIRTPVGMQAVQRLAFYRRVLEEIESEPGVESAGFASDLLITSARERIVTAEGRVRSVPQRLPLRIDEISPGFFTTVGTRLLRGRFFSERDGPGSPRTAIINQSLAKHLWPNEDPVNRRFRLGPPDQPGDSWFTVVGVVADMRRQGAEREPVPQMFESLMQNPSGGGSLVVRTSGDAPRDLAPLIESAVRRVDKHAPVYGAATLESRLAAFLTPRKFQTALVTAFSAVALLLAAIGIHALMQYSVATRTREIGIRMAVGADSSGIFRIVIAEGLMLAGVGLGVGMIGALFAAHIARRLLFGVDSADPVALAAASLTLIGVSAAACYFPARRATAVDPVVALRDA
jgi:putative ABC transport system permease protein